MQGEGIEGDATLEGNEEALQFFDDNVRINQLRHATRIKGRMTEQRVPYNLRRVSRDRLADWWAQRMDVAFFNHICGNTAQTDTRFTAHNATIGRECHDLVKVVPTLTRDSHRQVCLRACFRKIAHVYAPFLR
jgi:N4-gp56 family major capsid protein